MPATTYTAPGKINTTRMNPGSSIYIETEVTKLDNTKMPGSLTIPIELWSAMNTHYFPNNTFTCAWTIDSAGKSLTIVITPV